MNKNKDIEVLGSGVKSLVEHSLQNFSAVAKNEILGELAKNNMLKELLAGSEYIDLWSEIVALNGATFHEWLLTNPDEVAFEIWLRVRDREIRSKSYKTHNYINSAALIMYANLPQRLNSLLDKEWDGEIRASSLFDKKILFRFNSKTTEPAKQEISRVIYAPLGDSLMAIDIASIRGDIDLIKTAIDKFKYISNIHKYYAIGEGDTNIESFLDIIKNYYPKEDKYQRNGLVELFGHALLYANKGQLERIWFEMSETSKESFMQRLSVSSVILSNILKKERIDILDYLSSLKTKTGTSIDIDFPVEFLFNFVGYGKKRSVGFILKHNPELLEEKDWVYHSPPHKKKGTALTFALNNSNFEMASFLLSCGAEINPVKELLNYEPFIKDKGAGSKGIEFIARIEKFILEAKTNNKTNAETNRKELCALSL